MSIFPRFFRINDRAGSGYPCRRPDDKGPPPPVVVVPDLRAYNAFCLTQDARKLGKLDRPPHDPSRN